jgi:hypothetical protein
MSLSTGCRKMRSDGCRTHDPCGCRKSNSAIRACELFTRSSDFRACGQSRVQRTPSRCPPSRVSSRHTRTTGELAECSNTKHVCIFCCLATAEELTSPDGSALQFQDRIGQSARLPIGLKGISGCSVWHIGNLDVPIEQWAESDATLVGIVSGVYQAHGAVKVTRWVAVTTLINTAFPDLQPVLRLHLG